MPASQGPRKPVAAPERVTVRLPITLGQFLKAANLVASGGEAKVFIADGRVFVNGVIEQRRGHKLVAGDVVQVEGAAARVTEAPAP